VHWTEFGVECQEGRRNIYGSGMSTIALGSRAIDIEGSFRALEKAHFDGYSTLDVGGDDAVLTSVDFLKTLGVVR
jgi:inosose dehydratase